MTPLYVALPEPLVICILALLTLLCIRYLCDTVLEFMRGARFMGVLGIFLTMTVAMVIVMTFVTRIVL